MSMYMYLQFSLSFAGLLCTAEGSSGSRVSQTSTIWPVVTNFPSPTPTEPPNEDDQEFLEKVLEALALSWISVAGVGVIFILLGFCICIVTRRRRRRQRMVLNRKSTERQAEAEAMRMETYTNPSANLEVTKQEPIYEEPKPDTGLSKSKEVIHTPTSKSTENHYTSHIHHSDANRSVTTQNRASYNLDQIDRIDNKGQTTSMATTRPDSTLPIEDEYVYLSSPPNNSGGGTRPDNTLSTEDEYIYHNSPPSNSGMAKGMTRNESYGMCHTNRSTEEEGVYDNVLSDDPGTYHRMSMNAAYGTLPTVSVTEEEGNYDNDPTNNPTVSLVPNEAISGYSTTVNGELEEIYDVQSL